MMRHTDPGAGFTVIELLVSLMILAMIVSLMPDALRLGRRVWENDEAFERHAAIASFQRAAEQRLAEAMPIFSSGAALARRIDFEGAADRVSFVAPASSGPAGGGAYRFELGLTDNRAPALRQSLQRPAGESGVSTVYAAPASVAALAFHYFGAPRPNEPAQWMDQWPRQDALPSLIEMTIVTDGPTHRIYHSVVELRLRPAE